MIPIDGEKSQATISVLDYHVHTGSHTHTHTLVSVTKRHLKGSLIKLGQSCLLITGLKVSIYLYSLVLLIVP